jgi:hypothetical protein
VINEDELFPTKSTLAALSHPLPTPVLCSPTPGEQLPLVTPQAQESTLAVWFGLCKGSPRSWKLAQEFQGPGTQNWSTSGYRGLERNMSSWPLCLFTLWGGTGGIGLEWPSEMLRPLPPWLPGPKSYTN